MTVCTCTRGTHPQHVLPKLIDATESRPIELFAKAPELRIFTPNGGETIDLGDVVVDHSP